MTPIETAYQLFTNPETRPTLSGELARWEGEGDDKTACMCAQGCVLHHIGGVSIDSLINMQQHLADRQTAKVLGISHFRAVVLRMANDTQAGCPEDVLLLTPEASRRVLGPQGVELYALGEAIEKVSPEEWCSLRRARFGAGSSARSAARYAAWESARYVAWEAASVLGSVARSVTREAAWGVEEEVVGDAAWYVAQAAAEALLVRDLIGQHGFSQLREVSEDESLLMQGFLGTAYEQEHYDILTTPWRSVIGPIHPDDEPLTKAK